VQFPGIDIELSGGGAGAATASLACSTVYCQTLSRSETATRAASRLRNGRWLSNTTRVVTEVQDRFAMLYLQAELKIANTRSRTVLTKIQRKPHTAVGLVAFVIAGCALASRYLPITNHAVLVTAALSPYLMLCGPVSVLLLTLARRWLLAIVAMGLTGTTFVVQLPLYLGSDAARNPGGGLRVISANLREGRANPNYLVRSAQEQADVIAFQELTPTGVDRLSAAGLDATFPYRWIDARNNSQGVGVWSRFPLEATSRIGGYTSAVVSAQIRIAGMSIAPTVVVVHVAGPWPQSIDDWRRDLDRLPATLAEVAEHTVNGCVIVAGDLNSTTDMHPFRGLLRDGYRDAAEQSGAGIEPTFPANARVPPFIAIDHILTRNCTATSLRAMKIPGSDHRGLVATVMIPRSPASLGSR
jgi:endonuclease/exonuclease/phosphatase (EEP) superfamily protein YafD